MKKLLPGAVYWLIAWGSAKHSRLVSTSDANGEILHQLVIKIGNMVENRISIAEMLLDMGRLHQQLSSYWAQCGL